MYKTMTRKEKINYIYKNNKGFMFGAFIFLAILLLLFLIFRTSTNLKVLLLVSKIVLTSFVLFFIIKLFYPVNVFSKNIEITDGYIDERFHYDGSGNRRMYGRARTLDGSKCTGKRRIPLWFRHGMVPVKIIIYNNKACDFMLTKESYEYADEHRGELEKKTDKNSSIIGIMLIIIIIVGVFWSIMH